MTSSFEKIVRPNQLSNISPFGQPSTGTTSTDSAGNTVTLDYGKGGTPKVMFGSLTVDETYYMIKKMREKPKTNGGA
jgi:hypothetical protein